MTYAEMIDQTLDGPSEQAATFSPEFLRVLALHRLARAVEALAKQPTLLPLVSPQPPGSPMMGYPGVPTHQMVPDPDRSWIIPLAVRCQHCNARAETAEKVKHSPNCPVVKK